MVSNIGRFRFVSAVSYPVLRYPYEIDPTISVDIGADFFNMADMFDVKNQY